MLPMQKKHDTFGCSLKCEPCHSLNNICVLWRDNERCCQRSGVARVAAGAAVIAFLDVSSVYCLFSATYCLVAAQAQETRVTRTLKRIMNTFCFDQDFIVLPVLKLHPHG